MREFITLGALFLTANGALAGETYQPLFRLGSEAYNKNASICCFLDWGVSGWLSKATRFPDAEVYDPRAGKMVRIHELVKDRPIVLEMGSITCPAYDLNVKRVRAVEEKYKGKVDFYTLYVRENHPNDKFRLHTSMEQKIEYAKELKKASRIEHPILVDDVNGSLHQQLGNFGNAVYLIGTDMRVNHWSMFANGALLEKGIQALLAAGGKAEKAAFVGGTDIHPMAQAGFTQEEKGETVTHMKDRGDRRLSREDMAPLPEKLDGATSSAYKNLPQKVRAGILDTVEALSRVPEPSGNVAKPSPTHALRELEKAYREEFQSRYENWLKVNSLPKDEGLLGQQLREVK